MNTYQQQLFDDLITLVASNDAFYFQTFDLDGRTYYIFNYRLASYTDFLAPSALECRGIMFEVHDGKAVRLAAHPMPKFHNLNENPFTMNLDLSTVVDVEDKADGSLISSFIHYMDGSVRLKSKGSLSSEQAIDAMQWLAQPKHQPLKHDIKMLTDENYTVNMEWCSARPDHRIVIGHQSSHLVILNIRDNLTGQFIDSGDLFRKQYPAAAEILVKKVNLNGQDPVAFVASIPEMKDIEGYVVTLANGLRFKVKCDWYLTQHRAKDSINSDRRLFEAVIDECIDDLRSMFFYDQYIIARIDMMQDKIDGVYNSMVKTVEQYYEDNKHLSRKDYAIKGQSSLGMYFGLAMEKYIGRAVDFKGFIKGKWKELGIKDDITKHAEAA